MASLRSVGALVRLGGVMVATAVGFAPVAQAYILPAPWLLRQMVETRGRIPARSLSLTLHTSFTDANQSVEQLWFVKHPERARLLTRAHHGPAQLSIFREGSYSENLGKGWQSRSEPLPNGLVVLLMPKGETVTEKAQTLLRWLHVWQIDTNTVSLARIREQPCYVIGAEPWESNRAQLWLDKSSLQPRRLMLLQRPGPQQLHWIDNRFDGYGLVSGAAWLPRDTTTFLDGNLMRHATIVKLQLNSTLPENWFH